MGLFSGVAKTLAGGLIGGPAGALLGGLGGGDPTGGVPQFDETAENPELKKALGNSQLQSNRGESDLAAMQLRGAENAKSLFNGRGLLGENVDPAIAAKAQKAYATSFNDLNRKVKNEAGTYRMQRLNAPIQAIAQKAQFEQMLSQKRFEYDFNKYAARANVMKNIFGLAGAVGGAAIGGGLGAQVGAGAGGQNVGYVGMG